MLHSSIYLMPSVMLHIDELCSWYGNIVIMTKFSSQAAQDVVILTISSVGYDDFFSKLWHFRFSIVRLTLPALSVICMVKPLAGPQHCRMQTSDSKRRRAQNQHQVCLCRYGDSHYKDKTVARPSYIYTEDSNTYETPLDWCKGNTAWTDIFQIKYYIDSKTWIVWETVFSSTSIKTHWGGVTQICVGKITIIGSDNGLSPGRRQTIIWTNAGILLIGLLGTNFSEFESEFHHFHSRKCVWTCRLRNGGYFVSASIWNNIRSPAKPFPVRYVKMCCNIMKRVQLIITLHWTIVILMYTTKTHIVELDKS